MLKVDQPGTTGGSAWPGDPLVLVEELADEPGRVARLLQPHVERALGVAVGVEGRPAAEHRGALVGGVGAHAGLVGVLPGEEARPRDAAQRVGDEGSADSSRPPCASAAPTASSGRGPSRSRPASPRRCWVAWPALAAGSQLDRSRRAARRPRRCRRRRAAATPPVAAACRQSASRHTPTHARLRCRTCPPSCRPSRLPRVTPSGPPIGCLPRRIQGPSDGRTTSARSGVRRQQVAHRRRGAGRSRSR